MEQMQSAMTMERQVAELVAAVRALQVDLAAARAEVAHAQATADEAREIACLGALNPVERMAAEMKMIGRPETFDGKTLSWSKWSEVSEVFAGASCPPLAAAMASAERSAGPVLVANMDQKGAEISRQLGYWLVQACRGQALDIVLDAGRLEGLEARRRLHHRYASHAAGRFARQLMVLLSWDFSGDVVSELESFEHELGLYEVWSDEVMTDATKIGIVLRQLPESLLRRHMTMNAERLQGWPAFKEEILQVLEAQSAATGAGPMDQEAFNKGDAKGNKGGKGSGGTNKDKSGKENVRTKSSKSGDFGKNTAKGAKKEEETLQSDEPEQVKSLVALWMAPLTLDQNAAVQQAYELLVESGVDDEKLLGEFRKLGADTTAKGRKIVLGVDSCAAMRVVPRDVAPDYPVHENEMSAKGEGYRTAKGGWVVDEGTKDLVG